MKKIPQLEQEFRGKTRIIVIITNKGGYNMAIWVCGECGYEKEGRCRPKACPECGAAKEDFSKKE